MDRHPVNCFDVNHNLPWYVGGDLEESVARLVRDHLAACPECEQAHARALTSRERLLASGVGPQSGAASATPDLWPAVRSRLLEEGLLEETAVSSAPIAEPAAPSTGRILRPRFGLPLAAAAAAAVLLFSWSRWSGMGDGVVEQPGSNVAKPNTPSARVAPDAEPKTLLASEDAAPAGVVPLRRVSDGEDSVLERYNRAQLERSASNPWPGAATNGTSLTGQRSGPSFGRRRLR